jgi:predicted amidohydrolase
VSSGTPVYVPGSEINCRPAEYEAITGKVTVIDAEATGLFV